MMKRLWGVRQKKVGSLWIVSFFQPDFYFHSHISWLSFLACLKYTPPVIMNQTDELGYLDGVIFFPNCIKTAPNVILHKRSTNTGQTSSANTWKRWPNSSASPAKNNPDDTKWDLALTAHSSLETISPIMPMTCVSGMVSNKGCIMNSPAWWTSHNENALQSCQACCFNGLISEAIIVSTSQRWCGVESTVEKWFGAHLLSLHAGSSVREGELWPENQNDRTPVSGNKEI